MKPTDTDATHILTADHRVVEKLFEDYEKAGGSKAKREIADKICIELKIHAQIEEEIFYPALDGKIEANLLKEAYVEHDGAKLLINEIVDSHPDDDEFFDSKVTVLKEEIEHHVKEEEKQQGNMFQQARASGIDLNMLGEQMLARKAELKTLAKTHGLPPAEPVTM